MVVHQGAFGVIQVASVVATAGAFLTVRTREQLAPALAQGSKPVVIENADIAKSFRTLQAWQEARYWVFGTLMAAVVAFAISQNYKIELSWQRNWKIHTDEGKLILTPVPRR